LESIQEDVLKWLIKYGTLLITRSTKAFVIIEGNNEKQR